jgi:hypothetical protein
MVYAAHVATMSTPDEKGNAQREHIRGLVRMGKATDDHRRLLAGPLFPESLAYLWEWHLELARARTVGMNGPDPLTYQAIDAWARLTGREPWPHEVAALLSLDLVSRHPEAVRDA